MDSSSSVTRSSSRLICSETSFMRARIGAGVLAGFFQARDFVAGLVAFGLEAFVLSDEMAAFGVERFEMARDRLWRRGRAPFSRSPRGDRVHIRDLA